MVDLTFVKQTLSVVFFSWFLTISELAMKMYSSDLFSNCLFFLILQI